MRSDNGESTEGPGKIEDVNVLVTEQKEPLPVDGPDVWILVLRDMEDRRRVGINKYGVPVRPHNGRDALVDAYQELLDACVYMRQAIAERDRLPERR